VRVRAAGAIVRLASNGAVAGEARRLLEKAARAWRAEVRGLATQLLAPPEGDGA